MTVCGQGVGDAVIRGHLRVLWADEAGAAQDGGEGRPNQLINARTQNLFTQADDNCCWCRSCSFSCGSGAPPRFFLDIAGVDMGGRTTGYPSYRYSLLVLVLLVLPPIALAPSLAPPFDKTPLSFLLLFFFFLFSVVVSPALTIMAIGDSVQGFVNFVLFCVLTKKVREHLQYSLCCCIFRKDKKASASSSKFVSSSYVNIG